MTEIRFYHLERGNLEQALPALASKAYQNGHKIVIKTTSDKECEALNKLLWEYQEKSFLPHGTKKDGNPGHQPIWITDQDENPNAADVLILTHGCESAIIGDFTLCCNIFNGRDDAAKQKAREHWKGFQDSGFDLTYWQQTDQGWEKKDI